jgi:hypothetical protein
MTQTAIAASALLSLNHTMRVHPARLSVAGKTIDRAGAIESRGLMESARGGLVQGRKVRCVVPFAVLVESDLMDATTGVVLRQTITVTRSGRSQAYRVKRVNPDPTNTMWTIEAEQEVM